MAEIVRLLRWRAEWDGADLVDGAGKAAAAGERLKKSLEEVGAAGPPALKKTATAAKETDTAFEGLGLEAQQVLKYVKALESGAGSPLVMKRNAELAEAAFNVLAQSAGKAGRAVPEAFSDRVIVAIQKATTQAAGMNAELEKLGGQTPTKLDKVITALEKTEQSSAGAWAALRKMGEEGERAAQALQRLEAASNSPRELQRNAAIAELEVNQLREAIDRVRASGAKIGPEVGQALDTAGRNIAQANTRAAQLRDTMGDLKTRGDLAAKGFESAAASAGSFEGMLGRLKDTSGPVGQALADTGFKVVAFATAARMGYSEGEKLRKVLQELGVPLPNLSDSIAEMTVDIQKWATSSDRSITTMTALKDTLFNLVTGTRGMGQAYREVEPEESAAMARAREHLTLREQQAKAEIALRGALAGGGVAWKDGYQELGKLNLALADAELRLSRAGGNAKLYDAELRANLPTYRELADQSEKWGLTLEKVAPRVATVVAESKALAEAQTEAAQATDAVSEALEMGQAELERAAEAYDVLTGAVARKRAAEEAASNRTSRAPQEFKAIQDAAFGAAVAAGELGTNLDRVAEAVVATGGQMLVGAPFFIQIAQASDEATAALLRFAEASRAVREEQVTALEATRGWTDYVIALKEGYESGTTSLYNYVTALTDFKTQLLQMFSAAKGEAKESLQAMIDLINELVRTAGAGGRETFSAGPAGWLEKSVRDAKKGGR